MAGKSDPADAGNRLPRMRECGQNRNDSEVDAVDDDSLRRITERIPANEKVIGRIAPDDREVIPRAPIDDGILDVNDVVIDLDDVGDPRIRDRLPRIEVVIARVYVGQNRLGPAARNAAFTTYTSSLMLWNAAAIPWALVGAALLVLAAVVYSRQRASHEAVLFCMMLSLVAVWLGGIAATLLSASAADATTFGRIALAAVCLLPAAIYDFTVTALRAERPRIIAVLWIVASVFALIDAFSSGIVAGVQRHSWGYYPVHGAVTIPFIVFLIAVGIAQMDELLMARHRSDDPRRQRRIVWLAFIFLIGYLAVIDFVPMFGVEVQPMGYLPVLTLIGIGWSTITRHRLPPVSAARAAREILETMADALFVIDADGCIRVVNGAVRTLLGFSEADLLGRSIDTLEIASTDATISRTLRELSRRGPIRDQHRLLRSKEGQAIDVSISISPVAEEDVQSGAVVIARDIRERKRAEEELHLAMKRLEQSNRELEDFAYVASHDLQEPLRKIQAFGDRLKATNAEALTAQGRDYVERMQAAAARMQTLINDLLSFSRVTTKAQPFVSVDLERIAYDVAHDLEMAAHDSGGRIVIQDLPSIDADPSQMRQLLQNLLGNGLKFHREGVAPIVAVTGETDGEVARIIVSDNGIGFEEKYAERIFTMFERLHGRGRYEGTGIGLAICRKIAERHGGMIEVSSVPGQGSTFTVTLPIHHEYERETAHG